MSKFYITIDSSEEVMLPVSKETAKARAEEAAGDNENLVIVSDHNELFKAFKLRELVTLHNSVVPAQDAVASLGNKREASKAAYAAMAAYDFEQPASHQNPVERPRGRKGAGKSLEKVIVSLTEGGNSKLAANSIRTRIYEALVEFMGNKESVSMAEFKESLDDDLKAKFASAIRALIGYSWISCTTENSEGEMVQWGSVNEQHTKNWAKRQEEKAERERLAAAKKEQKEKDKAAAKEEKAKEKAAKKGKEKAEEKKPTEAKGKRSKPKGK